MTFETKETAARPDVIAPDGSEVRVLSRVSRGGLAIFTLPPQAVSRAIAHRTVEEVWYVISGRGRIWRKLGDKAEVTELRPGLSLSIPIGTRFQFRCDGSEPLIVVGATMPPWPGDDEAYLVEGTWHPTVQAPQYSIKKWYVIIDGLSLRYQGLASADLSFSLRALEKCG